MAPSAAIILGALAGGLVVDRLLARTGSKRVSRSVTAVVAHLLCAVCCLVAGIPKEPAALVVILSAGAFFSGIGGPTAWAAIIDISSPNTGVIFGIGNVAGNVGAMISPAVVGALLDYVKATGGDWNWVLYLFGGVYLLAAVFWLWLNPERQIFKAMPAAGEEGAASL